MTSLTWLADAILAMLLIGTLIMSIRLDRALRVVRCDRSAFETLITNLGNATASVKSGIQALRSEAEHAAEQVERRTAEADKLATDLSFLIEAAERAAAVLDGGMQRPEAVRPIPVPNTTEQANTTEAEPGPRNRPTVVEATTEHESGRKDGAAGTMSELYKLAGITTRRRPAAETRDDDTASASPARAAL